MHDTGRIVAGLLLFLGAATSPLWYQAARGGTVDPPKLKIESESPTCVADTSYMRALHMDLLNQWRDEAVRDGDRIYRGLGGATYEKSIGTTCLQTCHTKKEEFCDRCHQYVGAEIYCWDCHERRQPETAARSGHDRFERGAMRTAEAGSVWQSSRGAGAVRAESGSAQ